MNDMKMQKTVVCESKLLVFALILVAIQFTSCETPVEFERSNPKDYNSDTFIPNAPSNISLKTEDGIVTLSWKDNTDFEDGYLVKKAMDGPFFDLARLAPNTTAFVDTSRKFGYVTRYSIAAFRMVGDSLKSIATDSVQVEIGKISALTAKKTDDGKIELRWNDASEVESGFLVELTLSTEPEPKQLAALPPNSTSFIDNAEDLSYISSREYKVSPFLAIDSEISRFDSVKRVFDPESIFVPENFEFEFVNETEIRLTWQESIPFETGFDIERRSRTNEEFAYIAQVPANTTDYIETLSLVNEKFYQYRIRALDGVAQSAYSTSSWQKFQIPTPVLTYVPDASLNSLKVEWQHKSDLTVVYILERSIGYSDNFTELARFQPDVKSFEDQNVNILDERYQYRIKTLSSFYSIIDIRYLEVYESLLDFQGYTSGIMSLDFSPDGSLLASAGMASNVKLWDLTTGTLNREYPDTEGTSAVFGPNGMLLATAGFPAKLWDLNSGALLRSFGTHFIWDLAFSPDGAQIATIGSNGGVNLWDVTTGELIRLLRTNRELTSRPRSLAFNPAGTHLAATTRSNGRQNVQVFKVGSGALIWETKGSYTAYPFHVRFSPDGQILSYSDGTGTFLLNANTGALIRKNDGWWPVFRPDGLKYATIVGSGIGIWNASSGHLDGLFIFGQPASCCWESFITYSPDGQTIAAGEKTGKISLWKTSGGRKWQQLPQ